MKKQMIRLMLSAVFFTTNPLLAMDASLEKEEFHFSPWILIIQECSKEKIPADDKSSFRVISEDGTNEKIFPSNLPNICLTKNAYLIHSKDGEQIHVQNPYELAKGAGGKGSKYNMVITNKNETSRTSYNLRSVETLTVNPDGTFYAHDELLVNYVNLYENLPPQRCNPAMSRKDWKGRTYAYENGDEIVVYENQKELKRQRHKMNSMAIGGFYNNYNNDLYFYLFPNLHKINRDGNIIHTLTLPAAYFCSLRPLMNTPRMLHFWKKTHILILNKEEKFTELTTKDLGFTSITGAVATCSPNPVVYCYGPLTSDKAGIVKINLKGELTPPQHYGLKNIQSIKTAFEDNTLYVLGSIGDEAAVFVVKNDIMTKSYRVRPGHSLQGITSLEGYSPMPMVLKEFGSSLYTENGLDFGNFTTLCKRLTPINPTYEEGQAFHDFFAPIVAHVVQQKNYPAINEFNKFLQKFKKTRVKGYVQIFKFELSGGIDNIYKVNRFPTAEKLLEEEKNEDSSKYFRTIKAKTRLEKIVNSVSEPLKSVYNEHLESVNTAIEILKNLEPETESGN